MITLSSKHIDLNKELSVKILSNRSTARLLFKKTQNAFCSKVILDFNNIEFASKSFLDELNALIQEQDEKSYFKENMSEEVQKMDKFVQRSQEDIMRDSPRKSEEADMVAI